MAFESRQLAYYTLIYILDKFEAFLDMFIPFIVARGETTEESIVCAGWLEAKFFMDYHFTHAITFPSCDVNCLLSLLCYTCKYCGFVNKQTIMFDWHDCSFGKKINPSLCFCVSFGMKAWPIWDQFFFWLCVFSDRFLSFRIKTVTPSISNPYNDSVGFDRCKIHRVSSNERIHEVGNYL